MISRIKNSLTAKIFLITGALLITVCLLTYIFIACYMPKSYSMELKRDLTEDAIKLTEQLANTKLEDSGKLLSRFAAQNNIRVDILDDNESLIEISGFSNFYEADTDIKGNITVKTYLVTDADSQTANGTASQTAIDSSVISGVAVATTRSYPFSFADSDKSYELMITENMQSVNQAAKALVRILPLLIVVIIIISFSGSWFYSRYVTRPIVKISRISKKMSALEFDWHCENKRTDEIGILAASLNELSQKLSTTLNELKTANTALQADINLERELERKRLAFFSAVSHELKTPITVVKGQLEGMLHNVGVYKNHEKYLKRSLEVTDNMEDLVQELLTISRMESSSFILHIKRINFNSLLEQCMCLHEDLFIKKTIFISIDTEENLFIEGDETLLRKALNNLISNAVNYSPEGSGIFVKAKRHGSTVQFSIENTGVHIPEESIPELFNAFYRVEQSRNRDTGGSGLGLYIVKMILELHKAEYRIENTAGGVQFTLILHMN